MKMKFSSALCPLLTKTIKQTKSSNLSIIRIENPTMWKVKLTNSDFIKQLQCVSVAFQHTVVGHKDFNCCKYKTHRQNSNFDINKYTIYNNRNKLWY